MKRKANGALMLQRRKINAEKKEYKSQNYHLLARRGANDN
jgi:hypothetical protein